MKRESDVGDCDKESCFRSPIINYAPEALRSAREMFRQ
jgi:hypothetical protein